MHKNRIKIVILIVALILITGTVALWLYNQSRDTSLSDNNQDATDQQTDQDQNQDQDASQENANITGVETLSVEDIVANTPADQQLNELVNAGMSQAFFEEYDATFRYFDAALAYLDEVPVAERDELLYMFYGYGLTANRPADAERYRQLLGEENLLKIQQEIAEYEQNR